MTHRVRCQGRDRTAGFAISGAAGEVHDRLAGTIGPFKGHAGPVISAAARAEGRSDGRTVLGGPSRSA